MANDKANKDAKSNKKEQTQGRFSKSLTTTKRILTDHRTHVAFAIILIIFSIYLAIAMTSYFFTGESDASIIDNTATTSTTSVTPSPGDIYVTDQEPQTIQNWGGPVGARLADWFINQQFGIASFFLLALFILFALRIIRGKSQSFFKPASILIICLIWFSVFISFCFGSIYADSFIDWGGDNGATMAHFMEQGVGKIGTFLILVTAMLLFFLFFKESAIPFLANKLSLLWAKILNFFKRGEKELLDEEDNQPQAAPQTEDPLSAQQPAVEEPLPTNSTQEDEEPAPVVSLNDDEDDIPAPEPEPETPNQPEQPSNGEDIGMQIEVPDNDTLNEGVAPSIPIADDYNHPEMGLYDPTLDLAHYKFPTLDLLKDYSSNAPAVDVDEQNANKERIIKILRDFNIEINNIKAIVGPTVTLYEIELQAGVRVNRVRGLQDDIMMGLAAKGIRMMCPIPGKQAIGIEVPNANPQTVSMLSVLNSKKFKDAQEKYKLPVAIGKTITNEVFTFDLAKTPHVLVAGATGQGKSVGLNAIITSLLYSVHPAKLKFVMVDPKKVEFALYKSMEPQFLTKIPDEDEPIITDVRKVVQTLNSLTKEMDTRYDLLQKAGVRNIVEYNDKFCHRRLNPEKGHRFLPYIVVIVDEFGDLIMTAGKEVELPIARIAQLARAVGIHMIIATQRPSVNIITGVIKANFPTRIAFRVSSIVDSRTILDEKGAEGLIGRGDMLFSKDSETTRVQCAFVDTPEVESIVNFIGEQQGFASPFMLPDYDADAGANIGNDNSYSSFGGGGNASQRDPLFEEVARTIVRNRQGSTSNIQRQFGIGYNRAGRLMDQMEEAGIVGPVNGSKPRDILVPDEYSLEQLLNKNNQ